MLAEILAALIACVAMYVASVNRRRQSEIVEIFRRLNYLETEVARLEGSLRQQQKRNDY